MSVNERLNGNLTVGGTITQGGNNVQQQLVSGTNIKTINGNSVLGSGNLTVGGGGVHIQTKPISGGGYSNILISGTSTFANSGNILYLTPFIPLNTLTITSAAIQVTTLGASTNMKILVFSDSNGLPTTKLLESSSLDISTLGFKTFTTSFTFTAGTTYWIGTVASTSTGATSSTSQSIQIGVATLTNVTFNAFSTSVTFASIPSTLSLTSANLTSMGTQPRITFISA